MARSILQPEAGIFYGVCWIVVIVRLISRRLHRGAWKRLQCDDYLILVAMATDTVLIAVMTEVVKTSSNLVEPGFDVAELSQSEIEKRVFGSKLVLVVEQMQISTIWLIKTCLLIMYNRMTLALPQHWVVVGTSVYVGVTFVVMEVLYFAVWCRPFNQYWAVPPNSRQCSAATDHLITNAVFNISSDLIILSIPMPLLFGVRLPRKNKAILFTVFMIGAFTIVAAALNKYYSFTNPFGTEWPIWYLRESYTALLCANLPLIYPLIQRVFKLRNWHSVDYVTSSNYAITHAVDPMQHSMPSPVHMERRAMRRSETEDIMDSGFDGDEVGPGFITSAIGMEGQGSEGKRWSDDHAERGLG